MSSSSLPDDNWKLIMRLASSYPTKLQISKSTWTGLNQSICFVMIPLPWLWTRYLNYELTAQAASRRDVHGWVGVIYSVELFTNWFIHPLVFGNITDMIHNNTGMCMN